MSHFQSEWLGLVTYSKALALQTKKAEEVREEGTPFVMGLEHPATVTMGRRATEKADLITPSLELESLGIEVIRIWRGGEATLHSPGQLVIYPIFDLIKLELSVRDYMNILVKSTHNLLKSLGVSTCFSLKNPGLYTEKGKIAFFGIRVDRGITTHGISINLDNDLKLFSHIRSCGKDGESFDRLKDYAPELNSQKVFLLWLEQFQIHLPQKTTKKQMVGEPLNL